MTSSARYSQSDYKDLKKESYMKIDLFLLHDDYLDDNPKKCIVASGTKLKKEISTHILDLIEKGWTRRKLTFYFMKRLKFSKETCNRLVYLRKEFYHLVFLRELLKLNKSYNKRFELQEKIDCIKACQPPLRIYPAIKTITPELCKLAGAHAADGTIHKQYFSLSEGYLSSMKALQCWIQNIFGFKYKIKTVSAHEWKIDFSSKIITRYLTRILGFPNGNKTEFVEIPKIIKQLDYTLQKDFAKGFMTFESGIGIKNEVELCVLSKNIIEDLAKVFKNAKVKFVKMQTRSGKYWRIWSGKINSEEATNWLQFYEEETYKYNRLRDYARGYTNTAKTFKQAIQILKYAFPKKYNNKTSLDKLILAMKKIENGTRHDIKAAAGLKNFGGPWNGSLRPYLTLMEQTKIITTHIGKANGKSCQIYTYNPKVSTWLLPSAEIQ